MAGRKDIEGRLEVGGGQTTQRGWQAWQRVGMAGVPYDIAWIYDRAYAAGARVHSDSWVSLHRWMPMTLVNNPKSYERPVPQCSLIYGSTVVYHGSRQ